MMRRLIPLLWLLSFCGAFVASQDGPSRLAVDFSSSLIVSPDTTPPSVLQALDALLSDMNADGVDNISNGRDRRYICESSVKNQLTLNLPFLKVSIPSKQHTKDVDFCNQPATSEPPCFCSAPGNRTRCTCSGILTGDQYFDSSLYGLELAHIVAIAENSRNSISGGINANFNSTVRLVNSTLEVIPSEQSATEGVHDLELDESHLDLLQGSQLKLIDDADLEVEDAGTLWIAGGSILTASGSSNIQTQLSHILVEGSSSIRLDSSSEWNITQEADMTPAQAAAVCDRPFQPDAAAEYCFKHKEECKQRFRQLTGPEKQALGMLQYPPALDKWGRQAFDYADDVVYDDYYDQDYSEPQLEAGQCLGPDVCGSSSSSGSSTEASKVSVAGGRRLKSLLSQSPPEPAPLPKGDASNGDNDSQNDSDNDSDSQNDGGSNNDSDADSDSNNDDNSDNAATPSKTSQTEDNNDDDNDKDNDTTDSNNSGDNPQGYLTTTEVNAFDTLDGRGYDPQWGEGPFGESLCDAPPGRSFNYYGLVVRDNSQITISGGSTWTIFDTSRAFIKDSKIVLESGSTIHLLNSTLIMINSVLEIKEKSQILLEHFSSLQLYNSKVLGDAALYAVPAGATWEGRPWLQRGDYRASPGGGLPVHMGARPGVQLGTYPLRIFGFDLDARLLPAAGCNCKSPHTPVKTPADGIVNVPVTDKQMSWSTSLEGLI